VDQLPGSVFTGVVKYKYISNISYETMKYVYNYINCPTTGPGYFTISEVEIPYEITFSNDLT
jgi:hypothetical protein